MVKKLTSFLKKNWKVVVIALVAILAIVLVFVIIRAHKASKIESVTTTTKAAQTQEPLFNPKTISEGDSTTPYTIKVTYPLFKNINNSAAEAKLNQLLADKVNEEIVAFKKEVAARKTNTAIPQDFKSYLTIDYKVEYLSNQIASILFNEEAMLAGDAHPGHKTTTVNYNLEDNKNIVLTDLFAEGSGYLTFLSNNTIKYLKGLNISNDEMINAGAGPEAKNYANFYITDQAIVFVFDYYTVAPGVAGVQKAFFPFPSIKNMLIQDGILKSLLAREII
mgnify:CR=1 FL=1